MTNQRFSKTSPMGSDALACEAEGLKALGKALADAGVENVCVPAIYSLSERELILSRIPVARPGAHTWRALGDGLARIHGLNREQYGWSRNNWIGMNPQPNQWSDDWGSFFVATRLGYQVSLVEHPAVRSEFETVLARYSEPLADWLNHNCDGPALVHGDLWSGNAMFSEDVAWLIDPAVYCGDREVDVAMTELFGGFSPEFYDAYDARYPRTPAYPEKRLIYNLYHYLNHYNLFGGGYLAACRDGFHAIPRIVSA